MNTIIKTKIGVNIIIIIFLFLGISGKSQVVSLSTGNWNTAATWNPSGIPSANATVVINGNIILDKNLISGSAISGAVTINADKSLVTNNNKSMSVKSGGSLIVYGILDVYNVDFMNGSSIYIAPGGEIIVRNDFSNQNNSHNVIIDGTLTIYGAAYNGNGGIITGSGNINTLGGAFTGSGSVGPTISLPVELVYFTAEEVERKIYINWITASEINNNFFTIERSVDGINFTTVESVKGAGNSVVPNEYSYWDKISSAIAYYRLKQTDFNGVSSYPGATIVVVANESPEETSVYPNPIQGNNLFVNVENSQAHNLVEVTLTDISGKTVYSFIAAGSNIKITIPKAVMTPGIYVLTIRTDVGEVAKKLVVR